MPGDEDTGGCSGRVVRLDLCVASSSESPAPTASPAHPASGERRPALGRCAAGAATAGTGGGDVGAGETGTGGGTDAEAETGTGGGTAAPPGIGGRSCR